MKCTSDFTIPAIAIYQIYMVAATSFPGSLFFPPKAMRDPGNEVVVAVDENIVGRDKSLHSFLLMLFHTSMTNNLASFVLFETNVHCACKGKLYLIIVGY
ncbi:hypothetical protein OS493_019756 [Desmophyllum pertusum]|uniref:Uncharacterized protein n=1 Tax=Desmophyllum pertusum TaxID=174260 RepID=A0A9X0CQH5_9CNID|nr:hypothetical protein OS493_019756 [Desmophyllum pertusum]